MLDQLKLKNFDAIIYDMDGILINTEPYWKKAEDKVFSTVNIDFNNIPNHETVGMRIDEVVAYWHKRFPWENKSILKVAEEIMDEMESFILKEGSPMKGVNESLTFFIQNKMKVGLATSSYERLMNATLNRLHLSDFFHSVLSAEHLSNGKPHPEIYIKSALKLNTSPSRCLVIEDSINGIRAGKAAGMFVVAIPDGSHEFLEGFEEADVVLNDLNELIQMINGE
jgi:sugar-phosphatase